MCMHHLLYVCSLDYASPATAVRHVKSVRVFQHGTSYTRLPAYNVTHRHFAITPRGLPSQILLFPLQGTKYEHPIGDIPCLKKKVADKTLGHYRRSPSAFSRSQVRQNICTPDDRQVPSRAVRGEETFRHSRRSSTAFSRSEPPVKCDTRTHLTPKSTWRNMYFSCHADLVYPHYLGLMNEWRAVVIILSNVIVHTRPRQV